MTPITCRGIISSFPRYGYVVSKFGVMGTYGSGGKGFGGEGGKKVKKIISMNNEYNIYLTMWTRGSWVRGGEFGVKKRKFFQIHKVELLFRNFSEQCTRIGKVKN